MRITGAFRHCDLTRYAGSSIKRIGGFPAIESIQLAKLREESESENAGSFSAATLIADRLLRESAFLGRFDSRRRGMLTVAASAHLDASLTFAETLLQQGAGRVSALGFPGTLPSAHLTDLAREHGCQAFAMAVGSGALAFVETLALAENFMRLGMADVIVCLSSVCQPDISGLRQQHLPDEKPVACSAFAFFVGDASDSPTMSIEEVGVSTERAFEIWLENKRVCSNFDFAGQAYELLENSFPVALYQAVQSGKHDFLLRHTDDFGCRQFRVVIEN
jgi:hypothetical protein